MNALLTKAEQKLDWLSSLHRPLTEDESDELRRSLHAVYSRKWRLERERKVLRQHRAEELELLRKVRAEALQRERHQ